MTWGNSSMKESIFNNSFWRQASASAESALPLGEINNQHQIACQPGEERSIDLLIKIASRPRCLGPRGQITAQPALAILTQNIHLWALASCAMSTMTGLIIHKYDCLWQASSLKCYIYKMWEQIKEATPISCVGRVTASSVFKNVFLNSLFSRKTDLHANCTSPLVLIAIPSGSHPALV